MVIITTYHRYLLVYHLAYTSASLNTEAEGFQSDVNVPLEPRLATQIRMVDADPPRYYRRIACAQLASQVTLDPRPARGALMQSDLPQAVHYCTCRAHSPGKNTAHSMSSTHHASYWCALAEGLGKFLLPHSLPLPRLGVSRRRRVHYTTGPDRRVECKPHFHKSAAVALVIYLGHCTQEGDISVQAI